MQIIFLYIQPVSHNSTHFAKSTALKLLVSQLFDLFKRLIPIRKWPRIITIIDNHLHSPGYVNTVQRYFVIRAFMRKYLDETNISFQKDALREATVHDNPCKGREIFMYCDIDRCLKPGVHTRDYACLWPDWTVANKSGRDSSAFIAPTEPCTLSRQDPDQATLSRQPLCLLSVIYMHHLVFRYASGITAVVIGWYLKTGNSRRIGWNKSRLGRNSVVSDVWPSFGPRWPKSGRNR